MKISCLVVLFATCCWCQDPEPRAAPAVEQESAPPTVASSTEVKALGDAVESVNVLLKDRETLEALADRFPRLKTLSINYPPNGDMPEGAIAELTKFCELKSLVLKGDSQISEEEVGSISQLHTLKSLTMALP